MLQIKIVTEGLTEEEELKIDASMAHAGKALNSLEFKNFVHNFVWLRPNYKPWYKFFQEPTYQKISQFHYTELSNAQVYHKIMSGQEVLSPELDNEADIYVKIDRRFSRNVIGYTYPDTRWQWIYKAFFDDFSVKDIAANIVHEYCHKLGFDHEYRYTYSRQYSVPYAVGYFVSDFR